MPANWYRDGTATAVQGSTSVVGAGTLWTTQARMGDLFGFMSSNGVTKLYEVQSVTDNTHLTLALAFGDASVTSGEYAIIRNFNTTMTAETNAMLQSFIREWKLALQQNLKGDPGNPGDDGLSFRMGSGAPSVSLGSDGDGYLDFSTWDVYRRESGAWVVRGNVKGAPGNDGAAGSKLYPSTSNPSSGVGIVGDVAINTTSGDVFSRASTGWTLVGNIKGPKGDPGAKGDSVKGDPGEQGVAGSKWHWGAGTPSPTLGVESDNYLNTATGDCYQKTSGTWVYKSNLKGPRGLPGDVGPAGVTWRGAYSAETAYIANDGVSNAGCSYIALKASTGQTPPTPTAGPNEYWGFLSVKGADGEGSGDMTQEVYDPNKDGKVLSAELADRALNADAAARATNADHADGVSWEGVGNKPPSFTPAPHALSAHESATLEELNAIVTGKKIASTDEATTDTLGLVKKATDAEAAAGVATDKVVTSANLKYAVPTQSVAAVTIYVNSGNAIGSVGAGSDTTGDGSMDAPLASFQAAFDKFPDILKHGGTMVFAGVPHTYDWKPDGTNGIQFSSNRESTTIAIATGSSGATEVSIVGNAVTVTLKSGGDSLANIIVAILNSAVSGWFHASQIGTSYSGAFSLSAQALTGGDIRTYNVGAGVVLSRPSGINAQINIVSAWGGTTKCNVGAIITCGSDVTSTAAVNIRICSLFLAFFGIAFRTTDSSKRAIYAVASIAQFSYCAFENFYEIAYIASIATVYFSSCNVGSNTRFVSASGASKFAAYYCRGSGFGVVFSATSGGIVLYSSAACPSGTTLVSEGLGGKVFGS